jgi:hypothetical protein
MGTFPNPHISFSLRKISVKINRPFSNFFRKIYTKKSSVYVYRTFFAFKGGETNTWEVG